MPVVDTPVHEKVREKEGARYGCWNLPRPKEGQLVSGFGFRYQYRHSIECRFDMSLKDTKCEGCKWRGSGEAYSESIRACGS